ncbi:enoyl-CoA hydratase/isomerase family protein [Chloroflexota bacterium]
MEFQDIIYTIEDGIATITLNRPEVRNSLRYQMYVDLQNAARNIGADGDVRVVIITGSGGKAFCSGADIKAFYELERSIVNVRELISNAGLGTRRLKEIEVPVIGAANGAALGGGLEILCTCDFRIASETAIFGLPEVNLGLIPGTGGVVELPNIVGIAKAKEAILLGKIYKADEALQMGLVDKVVPQAQVIDEARALAKELAAKPIAALKAAKMVLNSLMGMDWTNARRLENEVADWTMMSNDGQEGLLAHIEKRKPEFKGEEYVDAVKKGMAAKRL